MAQFMTPGEHFASLLETMEEQERDTYQGLLHIRSEACFRGRSLVVYQIHDRRPMILDNLTVLDFLCNDEAGASCEIRSEALGETLLVGYAPIQLFKYPVFVHLPLHAKVRWSAPVNQPEKASLAFDMAIRTQSRLHLRERGVTYCETGVNYAKEFETALSY